MKLTEMGIVRSSDEKDVAEDRPESRILRIRLEEYWLPGQQVSYPRQNERDGSAVPRVLLIRGIYFLGFFLLP